MTKPVLKVTSHVGRDLLASAALFKTEQSVVWEYVVNGLQYVDDVTNPKIAVSIDQRGKEIQISDNGRGMTATDLQHFFTMHGENLDRQRGKPGRGKFGTGKAAGFGIGRVLTVDTRRDGKRNVVRLTREAIDRSTGRDIPIDWLVRDEPSEFGHGTTVTISQILLARIQTTAVIEYIERHLQSFRARLPEVAVNEHLCQFREPPTAETFEFYPSEDQVAVIGKAKLVIKVSTGPLPDTDVGVVVTAGPGNVVAVEKAGVDRKELGNYLFGEVDVTALDTTKSEIEAYDSARNLQLNPAHPVAQVLIPFIGSKLEQVRLLQLRKLSEYRKSEQQRRLSAEADKIAELINQDFRQIVDRLEGIRAAAVRGGSARARFGQSDGAASEQDEWIEGTTHLGDVEKADARSRQLKEKTLGRKPPLISRAGELNPTGATNLDPSGGEGKKPRPRGGFQVEYRPLGVNEYRSSYDPTTLTILINLDHPAVKNASRHGDVEEKSFRRLSYEIAFSEYSVALGYEMARRDPDIPADDLLYEVRSTLNRVSASAATLYA